MPATIEYVAELALDYAEQLIRRRFAPDDIPDEEHRATAAYGLEAAGTPERWERAVTAAVGVLWDGPNAFCEHDEAFGPCRHCVPRWVRTGESAPR